jgi:hypothetical protein
MWYRHDSEYHSHVGKDTTVPEGDLGAAVVLDLLDFFVWLVARAHLKLELRSRSIALHN